MAYADSRESHDQGQRRSSRAGRDKSSNQGSLECHKELMSAVLEVISVLVITPRTCDLVGICPNPELSEGSKGMRSTTKHPDLMLNE